MRNVWTLAAAQALAGCGQIMLFSFAGIVGTAIAPTADLATLPQSLSVVGVALTSLPAALLMQRIGRRVAFMGSAVAAAAAAMLCAWSIAHANFTALCIGAMIIGSSMAFVQQYRFAACEYVDSAHTGQAIATVMLGTLAAAVLGPGLGSLFRHAGGWPEYTGSFAVLALLCLIALPVLRSLPTPHFTASTQRSAGRSLGAIAAQRDYRIALSGAVMAYAVMSFIMTATPISMHVIDGFSGPQTTSVITAHLLAMYVPSLATGWLLRVLGVRRMMFAGVAIMALCALIAAVLGHHYMHYFVALMLLGLGWNLLFVASTTLLTRCYEPAERFRAQGLNDMSVFGTQALVSLLAGTAIQNIGWLNINLVSLPLLAIAMWAAFAARSTR